MPTAYACWRGQLEVDDGAQERVGDLEQDAGAVAGVDLGAGGAAVVEVAQRGERLGHDVVAGLAGQGRHEGDAAGVVLVAGVVETLGRREVRAGTRASGILPSSSAPRGPTTLSGRHQRISEVDVAAGDDVGPSGDGQIITGGRRSAGVAFQAVGPALSATGSSDVGPALGVGSGAAGRRRTPAPRGRAGAAR